MHAVGGRGTSKARLSTRLHQTTSSLRTCLRSAFQGSGTVGMGTNASMPCIRHAHWRVLYIEGGAVLPYAWPNPVDETASVQAPSQHKTFVLGGWGSSAGRAQAHATFSSRWSHALYLVRDEVVSSWKLAGTRAGNRPMHMYRLETSAHQRRPKHHTSRKQHIWLPHEPRTATRLPGCCTCIKTGHLSLIHI